MAALTLLPLAQAEVYFQPAFLPIPEATALFSELTATVAWRQDSIQLFGKQVPQPRLTAWYGDEHAAYSYSGLYLRPQPWTEPLQRLRRQVAEATGQPFNSVLLNLYRTGQDSMGWHADDEPELGPNPVIASVSLGATRRMRFRPRLSLLPDAAPFGLDLPAGSLLLMQGATQHTWQHAIPKTARAVGPRLNLTFRSVQGRL
ncbi:alpha-ketoglutarate-dependent dioxygenase AlkB [Hymenobacter lutimineralis]|uniref:Alpha-ketoglutarate-dependent dioxygenase AlkB n=1 Tax=Hymenobacter lutimineralis TaxID=2606448 RepID=A0A5D6V2U0_9BACT|nr:alpha-ketoglutarate-dependent dioxygenase AlkB [Hymenobacter lutimineralis]TYZ08894.1 alpha-ketoglutarate-dependent dioxygenase AlkB [Hymenobacter lutimineralis]